LLQVAQLQNGVFELRPGIFRPPNTPLSATAGPGLTAQRPHLLGKPVAAEKLHESRVARGGGEQHDVVQIQLQLLQPVGSNFGFVQEKIWNGAVHEALGGQLLERWVAGAQHCIQPGEICGATTDGAH
jgi:hypothetical protein